MARLSAETFLLRAREICGAEHVSWPDPTAALTVRPSTTSQVASLVRAARETGCRVRVQSEDAVVTVAPEAGVVLLDLRRADQVIAQDPVGAWVTVQAGLTPAALEARLGTEGFTLRCHTAGHGGRTLAEVLGLPLPALHRAGAFRRVIAVTAVWADGTGLRTRVSPRQAVGPDLRAFLVGGHGACCVVTELCLAVFPVSVPSGFETLAFSDLPSALEAARHLAGTAPPLSPLELVLARDGDRWLLHLWFQGPAACVAVGRDRAAHGLGAALGVGAAIGEGPARAFWRPAAAPTGAEVPLQPRPVSAGALAALELAPGEFVSGFTPSGAVHFALPGAPCAPVTLGESADPRVQALFGSTETV
jgi:FAD/FMN-containing dehydrogenase